MRGEKVTKTSAKRNAAQSRPYFDVRRDRIYDQMEREGIALAMFEDAELSRDTTIRWLTGHPGDALLFLSVTRQCLLVPWDINMANLYGSADAIIPYGEFGRQAARALREAGQIFKIPHGSRIEIPPGVSYLNFLKYVENLPEYDVLCRAEGIHEGVKLARAVKDEEEIGIYRKASEITNAIIDRLEEGVAQGKLKTESDAALFIEAEGRALGCEGAGFPTLAAGPSRSFGIHAFPNFTASPFGGVGLSILDFGLKYQGYTTDVTLTFARSPLSRAQERLLSLTEKAYKLTVSLAEPGASTQKLAMAADTLFEKAKKKMPHALGHGIGLETHEAPFLRLREDDSVILQPGMIFTLEPGLYDPKEGGCRLENDILITETGGEILTNARIIRL